MSEGDKKSQGREPRSTRPEGEVGRAERAHPAPEPIHVRHGQFGVHGSGDTSGFGGLTQTFVLPGESQRPYGGWFDQAVDVLEELLAADGLKPGEVIEKCVVHYGQLTIFVRREHLRAVCQHLRDDQDLRFELCLGVNGAHYPGDPGRELHAVYPFLSVTHNRFLTLEVTCPDSDPHIPSIVSIYPGNDWQERETWDLIGIVFDGHPALTRTAMPDDWVGHPQRKDYPLGGIPVEYKGATVPPADVRRSYN